MKRKKAMKSKKAVTMLTRAESLLSDVLDEYSAIEQHVEKNVRAVLLSAQKSVNSAMKFISDLPTAKISQLSHKSEKRRAKARPKVKTSVRAKKASAARGRR